MNEKLKELARRSGFVGNHLSNTVFGTCHETALETFAKFIVNECVDVCWAIDGPESSTDAGWQIRSHFGVEDEEG
jgi:hypothetical protein